ncbi:MAG: NAD(P)-binding domain-containing protein, partial [Nitrospinota bacterium]
MNDVHDLIIIGAGPGGLAAATQAKKQGLDAIVLEKGGKIFQGIIDSYPRGKKVYPTVPKKSAEPFLVDYLKPSDKKLSVEEYFEQVESEAGKLNLDIRFEEEFVTVKENGNHLRVKTKKEHYDARNVILAFGSNIPNELGIYGEAKTVARRLESPEDYIGVHCLVIGGGNTAADVVASISKAKRAADDSSPVYWAHRRESFSVDKDVARDLGEEILMGGHIKVLQGAIPRIGEVDENGMERLIIRAHGWPWG